MANYNFTPKDIYEKHFDKKMRGYDPEQVDVVLDEIIRDYETYEDEILSLREENEFLRSKISKMQEKPNNAEDGDTKRIEPAQIIAATEKAKQASPRRQYQEGSNFDVLKRLSRLEMAVFGAQDKKLEDTNELV